MLAELVYMPETGYDPVRKPDMFTSGDRSVSVLLLGLLSSTPALAQFERAPDAGDTTEAAAPRVIPPRLLHFEPAVYPKDAQAKGVVAEVVLRLTVNEQGAVAHAEVTEPVGHGFDQAAIDAAQKLTFEPALRDGLPVPARILYRYSFTLAPEPTLEAAPKPTTGNFSGVLRVAGTDSPLVGAEVVLVTPVGVELTTRSDTQGRFSFTQLEPGNYRVRVASPGFVQVESRETVVGNEVTEVTYHATTATEDGAIEVTVVGERPLREVTRRTIERREIERIPGTSGDALRSLESLPGVARPPAFAGILVVRGSYPEDTQVYVDGSLIPLVYHFGGLRSVLPTELLERIDFYPGNYGAKYGRGMGGIVDVSLKSPETRCKDSRGHLTERRGCLNAIAQVDLIEARVLLQGPLPLKGWSFAVGARRSWLDAWIGPVLESAGASARSLPVFSDYQFIVENRRSDVARTSLRFFGADDRFAAVVDPLAQEPAFGGSVRFGTSFMQGQILHEQRLSSAVSLSSLVTQGRTRVGFGIGSYRLDMVSHPFHWREELSFRMLRQVKLNTGFDFQIYPYEFSARSPNLPVPGQPSSGPFSSQPIVEASERVTGVNQGWYLDAETQPFDGLRVVPGFRVDYSRETHRTDLSPRLNARYDVVPGASDGLRESRRRTTLKGGVGYYHQTPQPQELNVVYGTPGLRSNRALHYSLGLEQELTSQLDVSLEGFYKDFDHLVAAAKPQDAVRYTNRGLGRSYGLEALVRYKPDRYFFGWIAYTLSRSERRDHPDDAPYLIPYDQTHNLTMLGSVRLGRGWEFGVRLRVISGSLTTPVREPPSLPAVYAADSGAYVPLEAARFSQRLPLFHQLDLRLDKRWQFGPFRFSTYLDVYNAYNHPATEAFSYDFNFAHRTPLNGIPILPSVGVRGEI